MSRKGYYSEYKINQMLKKEYPDCDIIRNPIADFMVIKKGLIIAIIEIKSIHRKKFYPTAREKEQIIRIHNFTFKHDIDAFILVDRIGKKVKLEKIWVHKKNNKNIGNDEFKFMNMMYNTKKRNIVDLK